MKLGSEPKLWHQLLSRNPEPLRPSGLCASHCTGFLLLEVPLLKLFAHGLHHMREWMLIDVDAQSQAYLGRIISSIHSYGSDKLSSKRKIRCHQRREEPSTKGPLIVFSGSLEARWTLAPSSWHNLLISLSICSRSKSCSAKQSRRHESP